MSRGSQNPMIGQTDTDSVGNSTSSFHSVDTIKPYTTVGNNNRNWRAHLILWPRDRRLTGRPIQESVGLAGTCLNMRRAYLMILGVYPCRTQSGNVEWVSRSNWPLVLWYQQVFQFAIIEVVIVTPLGVVLSVITTYGLRYLIFSI